MAQYNVMVLPYDNIDTDIIIPKQFLKQTDKNNLGQYAFYEWRYDANGDKKDHITNTNDDKKYNALITKRNFGCGSSREHAAWALDDYGFDVIIASSFSDIFYRNWLNNHKLPIIIDIEEIEKIIDSDKMDIDIDLQNSNVKINGKDYEIKLSKKMHNRLLEKIDEIDYTLKYLDKIEEFENQL